MNVWYIVRYVFCRPILAAGVVGSSIHLMLAVNQSLLMGMNYWGNLATSFSAERPLTPLHED